AAARPLAWLNGVALVGTGVPCVEKPNRPRMSPAKATAGRAIIAAASAATRVRRRDRKSRVSIAGGAAEGNGFAAARRPMIGSALTMSLLRDGVGAGQRHRASRAPRDAPRGGAWRDGSAPGQRPARSR